MSHVDPLSDGNFLSLPNATAAGNASDTMITFAGKTMDGDVLLSTNRGIFTLYSNGTLHFDPDDDFDFLGENETVHVSFTYRITDGEGGTAEATVTVAVTGKNDVDAVDDSYGTIAIDVHNATVDGAETNATGANATANTTDPILPTNVLLEGNVLSNDVDPEGHSVTVTAVAAPAGEGENMTVAVFVNVTDQGLEFNGTVVDVYYYRPPAMGNDTSSNATAGNATTGNATDPQQEEDDDVRSRPGGTFLIYPNGTFSFDPGHDFNFWERTTPPLSSSCTPSTTGTERRPRPR